MQRRDHAKQDAGEQRDREREAEHRGVEGHVSKPWQICRCERDERLDPAERKDETKHPASERQQQALRQDLPRDPAARGAKRGSHRQFGIAGGDTAKCQARDVRAGDEEHAADRAKEDKKRPLDIAEDARKQWSHLRSYVLVMPRSELREADRHAVHL